MRLLLVTICVAACATAPASDVAPPPRPTPRLADDWSTCSHFAFEQRIDELQDEETWSWQPAELQELSSALDRQDGVAVRAAVLLAQTPDEASRSILLARLEQRAPAPDRARDAGEILAAAALARMHVSADERARLVELAIGARPHPDLEVRVECAGTALAAGADEVVPFLFRVLRLKTPAEKNDPTDWEPTQTPVWAKTRAARALSQRAGIELVFPADGSFPDQRAARERLRSALAGSTAP